MILARSCVLLLALAAGTQHARAGEAVLLFDGETLDGWVAEGVVNLTRDHVTRPVWSVQNGTILCEGNGFGFLRYDKRTFRDFVLSLEYRQQPGGNSGVGIRTRPFTPLQSRATRPSFYSYEIQLLDDAGKPPSPHGTGSLYRYVAPRSNPVKPAGEWNSLEIECRGPQIRLTLNGELILDVDQRTIDEIKDKPLEGYICLQNHNTRAEFRNVHVRELDLTAEAESP